MTPTEKLRLLIWDKEEKVFNDYELAGFLDDAKNNVYAAAALCLDVVMSDPQRVQSYSRGGVSVNNQDLTRAVRKYEKIAGKGQMASTVVKRVYNNESY